jgi:hypothetical protein
MLTEPDCAQGGTWYGFRSTCDDTNGNGVADVCEKKVEPCPADWDENGVVNSTDVSVYLNDWFTDMVNGTTVADFNGDGTTNSTDFSEFLNAYFTSPPECG